MGEVRRREKALIIRRYCRLKVGAIILLSKAITKKII